LVVHQALFGTAYEAALTNLLRTNTTTPRGM
jgi:hypothetical protein